MSKGFGIVWDMEIKAVIFGTHEYQWALWPFAHLFGKYWGGQTVTYVGDRLAGDLPDNVEFMQVPCYTEGEWPWKHWFGNGVKESLRTFDDDVIAMFLPDHWIVEPVKMDVVKAMADYMRESRNALRGNLPNDTNLEGHGRIIAIRGEVEIIVCHDIHHCGKEAGTAMSPALWNREHLMELLEPHWGLWATEKLGTEKMQRERPYWVSVGTRPSALSRTNAIRDGKKNQMQGVASKEVWLQELSEEDRQVIREMIPSGYDVIE